MAPARSLLTLALLAATVPAWAQSATDASVPPVEPVPATTPVDAATAPTSDASATPAPSSDDSAVDAPAVDGSAAEATPVDATTSQPQDAAEPPPTSTEATSASTTDAPATAAEGDFDALYGNAETASGDAASPPAAYDPWEPYNRRMHRFNNVVDRRVARPLAQTYVKVVPRPVRSGVSNFFSNLGQPITAVNALLQGRPRAAGHALGRFVLNSTLGIGGVFDPATDAGLDNGNEDFGQTLGAWGWKRSRYVELPLFGPRTLRDVVGMVGDAPLSPLRQVEADKIRVPLQGMQLVDMRAQLLSTDSLREGAQDDYTLVRDAWMQRRSYQIDQGQSGNDDLPDYLKDEAPMVPVNAMPVMPPAGD